MEWGVLQWWTKRHRDEGVEGEGLIDGGGGDDEREVGSESFMSLVEVIKLGRVEEKR